MLPSLLPGAPRPAEGEDGRANTVSAFASQVTTAVFTAALTLVLLRVLGSHAYGVFALALAVGSLVLLPADLGVSGSTARFLAESRLSPVGSEATLVTGLRLRLVVSLAASGLLLGLAGPIAAGYGTSELVWPLRGIAIAVLGQGLMRFCVACLSARRRNSLAFLVVGGESLAETTASLAIVLAGGGAAGAAFGRAVGYAAGMLLGLLVVSRFFRLPPRRLLAGPAERTTMRRLASYAGALAFVDGVWAAFNQVDILLIGAILTSTDAGVFQAPVRLLALVSYPGIALGASIGPRLARTRSDERVDPGPLVAAARTLLVVQTLGASFVIAWAVPLTGAVMGRGYAESASVFAALGPYILISGLAPLLSNAIDYVGGTRRRLRVALVALAANIVLDIVLLPRIGVVGAAVGTDVGYAIWVLGHVRVASGLLRFPLGDLGRTLLRCLLGMAPLTGALAVGSGFGPVGFAASAVVGPAAFLAVLAGTGELRAQPWLARLGSRGSGRADLPVRPVRFAPGRDTMRP